MSIRLNPESRVPNKPARTTTSVCTTAHSPGRNATLATSSLSASALVSRLSATLSANDTALRTVGLSPKTVSGWAGAVETGAPTTETSRRRLFTRPDCRLRVSSTPITSTTSVISARNIAPSSTGRNHDSCMSPGCSAATGMGP